MAKEQKPQRTRDAGATRPESRAVRSGEAPPEGFQTVVKTGVKRQSKRNRGVTVSVQPTPVKGRDGVAPNGKVYGSAGKYTLYDDKTGQLKDDAEFRSKIRAYKQSKLAGLFGGDIGGADIAESGNIGYYSFEFPVDALELPQSRAEELRFYRLAYDRDPIVGRAIDLHTELPLSKMVLEKPKSSSEKFSDYVFDYFNRVVAESEMFEAIIAATREYWSIGEAFLFVEDSDVEIDLCDVAKKVLKRLTPDADADEGNEAENETMGAYETLLDYMEPKHSSWVKKAAQFLKNAKSEGLSLDSDTDTVDMVVADILHHRASLISKQRAAVKIAAIISRSDVQADKTAAPGDPGEPLPDDPTAPVGEPFPAGEEGDNPPPAGVGAGAGADADAPGDTGAPGGGAPMGGGGGGGFGGGGDLPDRTQEAIETADQAKQQAEIMQLKRLLRLLNKKKELLEELRDLKMKKHKEKELFGHICNKEYMGFERIQILPPEQVEIKNDGQLGESVEIYYKPADNQKNTYLQDAEVSEKVKAKIEEEGLIPLNQDPFEGSYVLHLPRKKSGYELHGRSILQRCIRTVIYREKLRQVQTSIASRNMTPKRLIVAPDVGLPELAALRAHVDEAVADPDYSIVVNYECTWSEIGSEGRLLSLDAEWQHTNSDLSIGLGFSPEILIGEGMYGGNRIQLEILNTTYLQFRDVISRMIEDKIFKPIAMKKGFYELDAYGQPRWVFPKVTFSRMALRDSGDLYEMMYNLHSKGSLPVSTILEFLNIDPQTAKRQLEEDLFTVNDSKFSMLLEGLYSNMSEQIIPRTDVVNKIAKGLQLQENDINEEGLEGSGEGA